MDVHVTICPLVSGSEGEKALPWMAALKFPGVNTSSNFKFPSTLHQENCLTLLLFRDAGFPGQQWSSTS